MPETTQSWREIVEKADKDEDRHQDSLYPYVWYFNGGAIKKRDNGPRSLIYQAA